MTGLYPGNKEILKFLESFKGPAMTMRFGMMAAWDKNSLGFKFMKEALCGAAKKNYPLQK